MKATFRFAAKACLMTAVGGSAFGHAAMLTAQDGGSATETTQKTKSKIVQTAGSQAADANGSAPAQNSDVTKELEKLYRKNGREMPSMNMDDLPNTQGAAPRIVGSRTGPATISSPTSSAQVKPGKPNWFERTFHVGRGRRHPQASPATPTLQLAQPAPQAPTFRPAPQPAPRPAAPVYRAPSVAVSPRIPASPSPYAQPQLQPQVQPQIQPSQQGQLREPAPIGAPAAAPALRPKASDDFSPFLDDSRSEKDPESLELDRQGAAQPPQILPNQSANGPAESPYSGARISPNEAERQMGTSLGAPAAGAASSPAAASQKPDQPIREGSPFFDDDENETKAAVSARTAAPAATSGESAATKEQTPPAKETTSDLAREKTTSLLDDDDDDDNDDEDNKPLTLPVDDPKTKAVPAVPETSRQRAPETGHKAAEVAKESAPARPATPVVARTLRGMCPVALKDERRLIEARPHIRSEYRGKIYAFSTVEAKELFDDDPFRYAPAGNGVDVVKLAGGETGVEGTLEHAAWYRGRLYLFASAETRREFVDAPSRFRIED